MYLICVFALLETHDSTRYLECQRDEEKMTHPVTPNSQFLQSLSILRYLVVELNDNEGVFMLIKIRNLLA